MKKAINEKIKRGYKKHSNKNDDYITSSKLWSKIATKLIWGMRDDEYVNTIMSSLPDDFKGKLLDIPVGTAILTYKKYQKMTHADITCIDYSHEMLGFAKERLTSTESNNIKCMQGDVGDLPFENDTFDLVLSMNGIHAFPEKGKAFDEIFRVLKPQGRFIGCFYIKRERMLTDFVIRNMFVRNGTFTPPFMHKKEVESFLTERCSTLLVWNKKSIVCFEGIKR